MLRLLLVIMCFTLSAETFADEAVVLDSDRAHINVYPHLSYHVDPSHQLSIQHIISGSSSIEWKPSGDKTPNFGYSESAYWFKLQFVNPGQESLERLFEVGYPLLDHVSLYVVSSSGEVKIIETGDKRPFGERVYNHRNFIFPLQFTPGDTTSLYVKVETTTSVQVPMALWKERFFMGVNLEESMKQGAFFGIMLVMAIYNLFIFFTVRDKSYLFYFLYVLSFGFVQGSLNGFCFQYLWPDLIAWNDKAIAFFTPFSSAAVLAFSLSFLGLKKTQSGLFLKTLLVLCCCACVAVFFVPYSLMIKIDIVLALVGMLSVFAVAILEWRSGNFAARYFILAWVVLIGSIVSYGLNKLGFLPRNFVTENMLQIGSLLEVVLLSFALADRVSIEKREKLEAQQLALEISEMARDEKIRAERIVYESHENEMAALQETVEARIESKAKSQFLATMSHEIRTPMNGVLGITELLQHTSLDSQQRSFLDIIKNSGQSLLAIINDILDYSKIVAGEMVLEKVTVDLEEMINECSELFSLMAEKKQIQIGAIIEPGTPLKVYADPVRLRQIITNLLGNAIKFTEKGHVLLTVKSESSTPDEACLRFEVSDTGIGVDSTVQEGLFSEFKQADSSATRKFGGTGLGLSICKRLVILMDGDIGIESELGHGACFWFTVKFNVHKKMQHLSVVDNDLALSGKNILVVSAEPLFEFLAQNAYERWGVSFENMASIDALFEHRYRLIEKQFDIVFWDEKLFMDHRYADMRQIADGFDASKTEFFLMTGLNCKWLPNELESLRMSATMRYPSTAVHFKKKIREMLFDGSVAEGGVHKNKYENFGLVNVLVAEDNPVNQVVVKGMLEKFSIYPDFVNNGLEAVKKFQQNDYDIIFMDCEMPEMDGLEATVKIRQLEKERGVGRIPIVALTAHALKENRDRVMHVGMDYFMVKPLVLESLRQLLVEIIEKPYSETA